MEITDISIKLVSGKNDKLQAFCNITIADSFVIRDLKIIEGPNGHFVAMPSRKLTTRCQKCGSKNHLLSSFCNECGNPLTKQVPPKDGRGRPKLHIDIAHPINTDCRDRLQKQILEAFHAEMLKWKDSGQLPPADADNLDAGPE